MAQYGKPEYWNERYTRDAEPFDWYQRYAGIKGILSDIIEDKTCQILHVGCGTSRLAEEMFEDGYTNQMCQDISEFAIEIMQKRGDREGLIYNVSNVMQMSDYPDEQFQIVVDKGTLDSILCGEGSTHNAQKALSEISRVLKPGGVYIYVSHGAPTYRLTYLESADLGFKVTVHTINKPQMGMATNTGGDDASQHYVYLAKKNEAK